MERNKHKRNAIHNLLAISDVELAKRYVKRNHKSQQKLIDTFNYIINIREEDDTVKYGAVACWEGACLDYIYKQIFEKFNSILINAGYQFKVENIVADLNKLLNDNAIIVIMARKDTEHVAQSIKDIVSDFANNVMTDKVLATVLGNKVTID